MVVFKEMVKECKNENKVMVEKVRFLEKNCEEFDLIVNDFEN